MPGTQWCGLAKRKEQGMRGLVPDAILDRRDKIGFATPEQDWLKTLRPWVDAALSSERARSIGALDIDAVKRDWQAIQAGRAFSQIRFP